MVSFWDFSVLSPKCFVTLNTDSALGLGRLIEATSPGKRSTADFRFGVTQIRSLCYLVKKDSLFSELPMSHQGEVHLGVLWVAHLHFVIPIFATLPSLDKTHNFKKRVFFET